MKTLFITLLIATLPAWAVDTQVDSFLLPKVTLDGGTVACLFAGDVVGATVPLNRDLSMQFPVSDAGLTCEGVRIFLQGHGDGWENAGGWVDVPFSAMLVIQPGEFYHVSYTDTAGMVLQAVLQAVRSMSGTSGTITALSRTYSVDGSRICSPTWPDCSDRVPVLFDSDDAVWSVMPVDGGTPDQMGLARNGVQVAFSVDYVTIKDGAIQVQGYRSDKSFAAWSDLTNGWVLGQEP